MENDLISVIIPIYNAEMYIIQCMECIRNQTYNNLEIILVNDGSEDKSAELCEKYREQDKRIKYFYKIKGGPASARNVGIRESCGKYIFFMDIDDLIEKDAIESLYNIYIRKKVDFVIGNAIQKNIFGENCIIGSRENQSFDDRKAVIELIYRFADDIKDHKILWTVWGKLYCSEIIKKNHIFYNEKVNAWEDTIFVIMYLGYCNRVYYLARCLYICDHYRQANYKKQLNCASGKMWMGPLDFRYIVRNIEKIMGKYEQVIKNCYSEYAIMSMFTSTRLLRIYTLQDLKKLYTNIYRIVNDEKLQHSIVYYVQKHNDNAKIIPFLIKKRWIWLIIITFKLQVRRIEIKNRGK